MPDRSKSARDTNGPHGARSRALIVAGLAWLGGGCVASAPRAGATPAGEVGRGGVERTLDGEAHQLLLQRMARADAVLDETGAYEATLVKEERIHGKLLAAQRMVCKVRDKPFAVYVRFLAPTALEGQEALFAGERYGGKLIARAAGFAGRLGAVALDPEGRLAMGGNRYPITETGMRRLLVRLRGFAGDGEALERLVVLDGAPVDGRPCTVFEALPRSRSEFALARIYFDDRSGLPVCFECFEEAPEGLQLLERYTYLSVQLGAALGDDAFDRDNPNYDLR